MLSSRKHCFLAGILIAFNISSSFSQTGPGGIGKTDGTSNLRIWLRADLGVFSDVGTTAATNGQTVTQWNDQSGSNLHGTQLTAANKPLFSATLLNGLPALNFTDDLLDIPFDISPATNPNITVVAVVTHNTATALPGSRFFGHDDGGFDRTVGFDDRGGPGNTYTFFNGTGVVAFASPPANQAFITTNAYSATAFSGWIAGTQLASNAAVANGSGKPILSVGNITTTASTPFFDAYWRGNIAEFIVYNKILSNAERIILENYLSAKYNATLTTNNLYIMDDAPNGNFDFDVAGIGQAPDASNVLAATSNIVTISNATALANNRFLIFGHNNGATIPDNTDLPAGVVRRLPRVWRASETTDIGNTTVAFDLTAYSNANTADLRLLIDRNNNGIFSDETNGVGVIGGAVKAGNIYSFNTVDIADGQRFTVASAGNATLPITLSDFSLVQKEQLVTLNWSTSDEKNGDYFEVEKSIDATGFDAIGKITATGKPSTPQTYSFIDRNPAEGISYYRLKITDIGGAFNYSNILRLEHSMSSRLITLAPNPVVNTLTIKGLSPAGATIQLLNANGRMIREYKTTGSLFSLAIHEQPTGMYTLRIVDNKGVTLKTIIKQ